MTLEPLYSRLADRAMERKTQAAKLPPLAPSQNGLPPWSNFRAIMGDGWWTLAEAVQKMQRSDGAIRVWLAPRSASMERRRVRAGNKSFVERRFLPLEERK